ncbi:YcbK family protein [Pseudomonas luteola]|uniref:YcbK family protein n=1 Tax=Pseudomonas sp. TaxID=306 RepID=UPI00289BF906|nr:DUF882 domain-containing protein [Pseudomonas sp.]
MTLLTRRSFVHLALTTAAAAAFPEVATAKESPDWRLNALNRDRYLKLIRPQSGEQAVFCYWRKDKGWDMDGYRQACWLLRDVQYNAQVQMDPGLLDTLFILQIWLATYGQNHEIRVNSGYRTAKHNSRLENAAKNSMHLYGKAADIRIPGVSPKLLSDMGKMLGLGGVGLYEKQGFIHVDRGSVRSWKG